MKRSDPRLPSDAHDGTLAIAWKHAPSRPVPAARRFCIFAYAALPAKLLLLRRIRQLEPVGAVPAPAGKAGLPEKTTVDLLVGEQQGLLSPCLRPCFASAKGRGAPMIDQVWHACHAPMAASRGTSRHTQALWQGACGSMLMQRCRCSSEGRSALRSRGGLVGQRVRVSRPAAMIGLVEGSRGCPCRAACRVYLIRSCPLQPGF
jgi:hypothetical protein